MGVAVYDDKQWFEYLVLDSFQAGLSWKIILHKREAFRQAFHHFDVHKVATMSHQEMQNCLQNKAIIRNWLKIKATVTNAQAFLRIQADVGSFNQYIWSFTNGQPIHHYCSFIRIPTTSDESDASKDLKNRGLSLWEAPFVTPLASGRYGQRPHHRLLSPENYNDQCQLVQLFSIFAPHLLLIIKHKKHGIVGKKHLF